MDGSSGIVPSAPIVPCAVRVALHPIEALRVVSTLVHMQTDPRAASFYLTELFRGTEMARAVLTLCARLDAARFENPDVREPSPAEHVSLSLRV